MMEEGQTAEDLRKQSGRNGLAPFPTRTISRKGFNLLAVRSGILLLIPAWRQYSIMGLILRRKKFSSWNFFEFVGLFQFGRVGVAGFFSAWFVAVIPLRSCNRHLGFPGGRDLFLHGNGHLWAVIWKTWWKRIRYYSNDRCDSMEATRPCFVYINWAVPQANQT